MKTPILELARPFGVAELSVRHMKSIGFILIFVAFLLALLSCQSPKDALRAGVSTQESIVLSEDYYYGKGFSYPTPTEISDQEISESMRKSTDSSLDGEKAEAQTSRLVTFLAVVGDDRFAKILSGEDLMTQKATGRFIRSMWDYHHFSYPKTQRIIASAQQAEQGAAANP